MCLHHLSFLSTRFFLLTPEKYKNLTASQQCADPFFQEWVFHPLGGDKPFFLDTLISRAAASVQMQIAKDQLLQYSNSCAFIAQCIQRYTRMKEELREHDSEENFVTVQEYWTGIHEI
jgi:hypothetical protein